VTALEAVYDSLTNWMEIQAPEDARQYDEDACELARKALRLARGEVE